MNRKMLRQGDWLSWSVQDDIRNSVVLFCTPTLAIFSVILRGVDYESNWLYVTDWLEGFQDKLYQGRHITLLSGAAVAFDVALALCAIYSTF